MLSKAKSRWISGKKIILAFLIIISVLFFIPSLTYGQGPMDFRSERIELTNPGILPDEPLYFFKIIQEQAKLFLTSEEEKQGKEYLHLAELRLGEYQKMTEKGKQDLAEKSLEKYQTYFNKALEKLDKIKGNNKTELVQEISRAMSQNLRVLHFARRETSEQMSEEKQEDFNKVMDNLQEGHIKLMEIMRERNN